MTISHLEEVERWRVGRLARLTGPDGWLALVGLAWLEEGPNSMGPDRANRVVLPWPQAPPHVGSIDVAHGRATANLTPGSGVLHEGAPATTVPLRDDTEGRPTVLELGPLRFHVIRREGRLAVRIRDRESPARQRFSGIEHYPVDVRWRLLARFEPYEPAKNLMVPTVTGREESYRVPGAVAFDVDGQTHRLDAFLEPGETDLFIVFGDQTNGTVTFGGGRYLYAEPPESGTVVLDFNRAYNPPCVFSPYVTCALPLPQNVLPIRVEAGEKRYGDKG